MSIKINVYWENRIFLSIFKIIKQYNIAVPFGMLQIHIMKRIRRIKCDFMLKGNLILTNEKFATIFESIKLLSLYH